MVKSFVSMVCACIILITGAFFEDRYLHKEFEEFNGALVSLYQKVDEQTAVMDDVYAVQKNWLNKKKFLHAFIPHTEIKEVDLWLAEAVTLVRDKEWVDAISKIEVLIELTEQIPQTFEIRLSNIL